MFNRIIDIRTPLLVSALTSVAFAPADATAQTASTQDVAARARGLEIASEVARRDDEFRDLTANLVMVLRNAHGEESTRQIRSRTLEVEGDGDRTLVIFDQPRDVAGSAFLNYTHKEGDDDQWLYLPALERVKRISSSNQSGPFMGSEFAYEDISSQEVEKYDYRFIAETQIEGRPAFQVERYPLHRKSGYARQVVWYDAVEYRPEKVDFYDRKDELLKTLVFSEYQQYLGRYWRAGRMEMVNHQTGKSTVLEWSDYTFQTGLTDRDFDRNSLQRAR